jgi:hypothetical protein
MQEEAVRWSIKVSKDTDLTLRTFLGAQGAKKGDLSKFGTGRFPSLVAGFENRSGRF